MSDDKPRVLLVDDQPKLLTFIEIGLKARGYSVEVQCSGKDALESVRNEMPGIIVLDIRMPEMDGFEVLRRLRSFTDIPVIAYSATPEFSGEASCFREVHGNITVFQCRTP